MLTVEQRKQMLAMVRDLLGLEKSRVWWETPNPMLGNVRPWVMAMTEKEDKLYRFISECHAAGDQLVNQEISMADDDQKGLRYKVGERDDTDLIEFHFMNRIPLEQRTYRITRTIDLSDQASAANDATHNK